MATTGNMAGTGLTTTSGIGAGTGTYGRVILTIKSAHNMNDKAFIGKSDPYCVVKVSDAEIQTAHVKNAGEHCVWDESFAFNNVSPTDIIEFKVYDHNRLIKDALMGEGSLSLRQVFEEGRLETRVPLASRSGVKDAGEVWIALRKEDSGATAGTGATGAGYERSGLSETGKAYEGQGAGMAGMAGMTTEREAGYGDRERYNTREAAVPASAAVTETSGEAGYIGEQRLGEARQTGREAVCGQEYYTKVEDRPVIKEHVTYIKEHRPVEKEFVVETRATGQEREMHERREQESLGTKTRVVEEARPADPCA